MAQTRRMGMQNERIKLQMRRGFRPTITEPRGHIAVPQCPILTATCGRGTEAEFFESAMPLTMMRIQPLAAILNNQLSKQVSTWWTRALGDFCSDSRPIVSGG